MAFHRTPTGGQPASHPVALQSQPGWPGPSAGVRSAEARGRWSGLCAGGRWRVWLGRGVLWAAAGVLLLLGVGVLFRQGSLPDASEPQATAARGFAVRFAKDYLSGGPEVSSAASEASALEPPGEGLDAGSAGGRAVGLVVVERVEAVSPQVVVVTVAAEVTGRGGPRWWHLAVPVYADGEGRLAVAGAPALVPAAGTADPPAAAPRPVDEAAAEALRTPLLEFFRAYAGSDPGRLARRLAPGAANPGTLGGVVALDGLRVRVPPGGPRRTAVATARWVDAHSGARFTQTYDVLVLAREGVWYVERVGVHRPGAEAAQAGR